MSDEATIPLRGDNEDLLRSLNESLSVITGWGGKVKGILGVVAAAFAVKEVWGLAKGFVEGAQEAEIAGIKLDVTIKNLGEHASMTREQVEAFGKEMMSLTRFEDDAAIAAQNVFLRLGTLDDTTIKRATKAAADLAETMGGDLGSAAQRMMMAMKDPERGIMQLRSAGIKFTDTEVAMIRSLNDAGKEAEAQAIILDKLEKTIGGTAEAVAKSSSGQWTVFQNKLADLGEDIGSALIPIILELGPVLEGVSNFLTNVIVPAITTTIENLRAWGATFSEYIKPVLEWFVEANLYTFTAVQTAVQNFVDVARLAMLSYVLTYVKAFEIIKYWLVEVTPAYLKWFGTHWHEVFTDIGNLVYTVMKNAGENLAAFWDALKSFMSGDGFNFEATPLMQGFESVMTELPVIAERVKSDLEKGLETDRDAVAGSLANAFDKNLAANREKLGKFMGTDPFGKPKTDAVAGNPDFKPMEQGESKAEKEAREKAEKEKEKAEKEKAKEAEKGAGASFVGLEDLGKKIAEAAAGRDPEKDPAAATKVAGEKTVEATKEVSAEVKKQNDIMAQQLEAMNVIKEKIGQVGTLA